MAVYEIDLRNYFTTQAVAEVLKALPPLRTPVMDRVYQDRRGHPMPVIGIDEITELVQNVPVVRRGTEAVVLQGGQRQISYLEPQPVEVSSFVGAKELNDLKLLGQTGIQQWVSDKVDKHRRAIRKTAEALAAQSLKGQITYAMKTTGGLDTYQVDFGSTLSFTPQALWSDANKKIGDILKDLVQMQSLIQENSGFGGTVSVYAGVDAFSVLVNKVVALGNDARVAATVTESAVNVAGFKVELLNSTYRDLLNNQDVKVVDDNSIVMIGTDAPFRFRYLAIDDLDAGLQPLPFYTKTVKKDNPSGYDVISKSKPLPIPVPKAICWAQVV